jgi:hypothetical protein
MNRPGTIDGSIGPFSKNLDGRNNELPSVGEEEQPPMSIFDTVRYAVGDTSNDDSQHARLNTSHFNKRRNTLVIED